MAPKKGATAPPAAAVAASDITPAYLLPGGVWSPTATAQRKRAREDFGATATVLVCSDSTTNADLSDAVLALLRARGVPAVRRRLYEAVVAASAPAPSAATPAAAAQRARAQQPPSQLTIDDILFEPHPFAYYRIDTRDAFAGVGAGDGTLDADDERTATRALDCLLRAAGADADSGGGVGGGGEAGAVVVASDAACDRFAVARREWLEAFDCLAPAELDDCGGEGAAAAGGLAAATRRIRLHHRAAALVQAATRGTRPSAMVDAEIVGAMARVVGQVAASPAQAAALAQLTTGTERWRARKAPLSALQAAAALVPPGPLILTLRQAIHVAHRGVPLATAVAAISATPTPVFATPPAAGPALTSTPSWAEADVCATQALRQPPTTPDARNPLADRILFQRVFVVDDSCSSAASSAGGGGADAAASSPTAAAPLLSAELATIPASIGVLRVRLGAAVTPPRPRQRLVFADGAEDATDWSGARDRTQQ